MQAIKTATTALVTTALLAGGVLTATPASAGIHCNPHTKRTYRPMDESWWLVAASGTVRNTSKGQVNETVHFSRSGTRTTSVSGEVGASVSVLVAEINANTKYNVERSKSYTKGRSTTITAPARTTVKYKIGVKKRRFAVTKKQVWSNCKSKATTGVVNAVDATTELW